MLIKVKKHLRIQFSNKKSHPTHQYLAKEVKGKRGKRGLKEDNDAQLKVLSTKY